MDITKIKYDVATSPTRRNSAKWKNSAILWPQMVSRLANPVVTGETYSAYMRASKDKQADIKDVGGYVAGYLTGGKRGNNTVLTRSMLTLDLDFASMQLWSDFTELFDCAAVLHSTHKHSPKLPRFRLIIPLDRKVNAAEHEALARKLAEYVNIDFFDDTTFEMARMMFWPSISKNAKYYFKSQEGAPLDVDSLLSEYDDHTDMQSWEYSSRVEARTHERADAMENPLDKKGWVGAFCNAYSISEAIDTFIPDIYIPVVSGQRYTYADGSTSAGVVVYDDLFLFSHHGTDPIGGQTCNAFDLVRIHKYNHLDDAKDASKDMYKRPSVKRMIELACVDEKTIRALNEKRVAANQKLYRGESVEEFNDMQDSDDFGDWSGFEGTLLPGSAESKGSRKSQVSPDEWTDWDDDDTTSEDEGEDTAWLGRLKVDSKQRVLDTIDNVALILENDQDLKGFLKQDDFAHRWKVVKDTPWIHRRNKVTKHRDYEDFDDAGVCAYIETNYDITKESKVRGALRLVAARNAFNPLQETIKALEWDGVPRVDTFLTDVMGVVSTPLTSKAGKVFMQGCIKRAFEAGCKFDIMLILQGKQGDGKGTFCQKLSLSYFSELNDMSTPSKLVEQLMSSWIVEVVELSAFGHASVEKIKQVVGAHFDRYRRPFDVYAKDVPRSNVFIGSTNRDTPLLDTTGNRRFFCVNVNEVKPKIDVFSDEATAYLKQVVAESYQIYLAGTQKHYFDKAEENEIRDQQSDFLAKDARQDMVERYLDIKLPVDWKSYQEPERKEYIMEMMQAIPDEDIEGKAKILRNKVVVADIWTELFGKNKEDITRKDSMSIGDMLRCSAGWTYSNKTLRTSHNVGKGYVRVNETDSNEV